MTWPLVFTTAWSCMFLYIRERNCKILGRSACTWSDTSSGSRSEKRFHFDMQRCRGLLWISGILFIFVRNMSAHHLRQEHVYQHILDNVGGVLRSETSSLTFNDHHHEHSLRHNPAISDVGYGSRIDTGSDVARKNIAQTSVYGLRGPGRRRKRAASIRNILKLLY